MQQLYIFIQDWNINQDPEWFLRKMQSEFIFISNNRQAYEHWKVSGKTKKTEVQDER
jgi:hypothetical protein